MEAFIQEMGARSQDHVRSDSRKGKKTRPSGKRCSERCPEGSQVRLNHSQGCNWSPMVGQASLQLPKCQLIRDAKAPWGIKKKRPKYNSRWRDLHLWELPETTTCDGNSSLFYLLGQRMRPQRSSWVNTKGHQTAFQRWWSIHCKDLLPLGRCAGSRPEWHYSE